MTYFCDTITKIVTKKCRKFKAVHMKGVIDESQR